MLLGRKLTSSLDGSFIYRIFMEVLCHLIIKKKGRKRKVNGQRLKLYIENKSFHPSISVNLKDTFQRVKDPPDSTTSPIR